MTAKDPVFPKDGAYYEKTTTWLLIIALLCGFFEPGCLAGLLPTPAAWADGSTNSTYYVSYHPRRIDLSSSFSDVTLTFNDGEESIAVWQPTWDPSDPFAGVNTNMDFGDRLPTSFVITCLYRINEDAEEQSFRYEEDFTN